jgi:2-iminobutanoate/2-iminopropanoate deaminase
LKAEVITLTQRERVETANAPTAIGAYSQAIRLGNLVFSAGQLGIDPRTGDLVEGGITGQARRVLDNLSAVLEAAGSSMDNVVKTTVFLSDMSNFAAMNEVYKQYFSSDAPPARSTIQVAGLPLGALVEIDCVAVVA